MENTSFNPYQHYNINFDKINKEILLEIAFRYFKHPNTISRFKDNFNKDLFGVGMKYRELLKGVKSTHKRINQYDVFGLCQYLIYLLGTNVIIKSKNGGYEWILEFYDKEESELYHINYDKIIHLHSQSKTNKFQTNIIRLIFEKINELNNGYITFYPNFLNIYYISEIMFTKKEYNNAIKNFYTTNKEFQNYCNEISQKAINEIKLLEIQSYQSSFYEDFIMSFIRYLESIITKAELISKYRLFEYNIPYLRIRNRYNYEFETKKHSFTINQSNIGLKANENQSNFNLLKFIGR